MIIVILGPSGTGKTKLSIELAKKYEAEIINADSVQIYKDVNIGSAKIKDEEMDGIKHHLLSTKSLDESNTIFDYQKEGREILDKLINENKNVIIVGGSGLYIKALLYDYNLEEENKSNFNYDNLSNEDLKKEADEIYKENNIHTNNRQRLIRFIDYYKLNNKILLKTDNINKRLYDFTLLGLEADRSILYERTNDRVDEMINEGLIEEAKNLYNKKYEKLNGIIGYKELIKYFNNEITKEEAIDEIKRNTRRYVKRQYTWFKNQMDDIKWINVDYNNFNNTINEAIKVIEKEV